jgi:hypothetical protein
MTPVVTSDIENNTITLNANSTEMLRVAKDGFYVRGKRVNQDDKEAEIVYNTFHQWLTWATLNRTY